MRDYDVKCPYCNHEFDSDDKYNADLYQENDDNEVQCPSLLCKKRFMVKVVSILRYEVASMEDFEEDGGFF